MTPQNLIDVAVHAADQIDAEQPTLRTSGQRISLPGVPGLAGAWLAAVAARANKASGSTVYGVKDAGAGHPISYDTIGIKPPGVGTFYAVKLCRDGEGYTRAFEDYGEVPGNQNWYAVPAEDDGQPPATDLEARVSKLEAAFADYTEANTAALLSIYDRLDALEDGGGSDDVAAIRIDVAAIRALLERVEKIIPHL